MKKQTTEILAKVSELSVGDKSDEIYDDWSSSYDADLLEEFGYISPRVAVEALIDEGADKTKPVIDYGCGTGLVGLKLLASGFEHIDGVDISAGMLAEARTKQVYRHLLLCDLTAAIALQSEVYHAGCCIGSMGAGHIGAEHVAEMLRPLRVGGLFVIIMNGSYYHSGGFETAFERVQDDGLWQIRQLREFNYMSKLVRPGWLLVAKKS